MSDSVCTPDIPITRNIDGFTFVNQTVHIAIVEELESQVKARDELLRDFNEVVLMYMRRFNGASMVKFIENKPILDSDEVRTRYEAMLLNSKGE